MSTIATARTSRPTILPYLRTELTRRLRDGFSLFFILALPVALYLMFGATASWADERIGSVNGAFSVMVTMAAYGAVTAMTSLTAMVALERQQGWQRQLSLTGLSTGGFVAVKVGMALLFTAIGAAAVFVVGALTGAEADSLGMWAATFALVVATSPMFGIYGLAVALLFRSDAAVGLASALLTLFAFFGNMFLPLEGTMLQIARFTPMYGLAALVRRPFTEGNVSADVVDPLWAVLLNIAVWTAVFTFFAAIGLRRSRGRT